MSLSQLSVLSAQTAISFNAADLAFYKQEKEKRSESEDEICIFVSIDDRNLANVEQKNVFQFGELLIKTHQSKEPAFRRVLLGVESSKPAEWQLLVQLRIKSGRETHTLNVVDKDVFKFDPFSHPLNIEVQGDDIKFLKFEMRTLNVQYLEHPKFTEGDQVIEFDDGSRIRIHPHILSVLSGYMEQSEKAAARRGETVIKVTSTEKEAFCELLYQVYPTRRPIYSSFRRLASAAVGYRCEELIYHLSRHLIEYNFRPLTFMERLKAAVENRLEPAIRELAFRAAMDGTWSRMIQSGFEPENFCGRDVYTKIVCPAILQARHAKPHDTLLVAPKRLGGDFLAAPAGDDYSSKATILFRGTKFYINRGLLMCHGVGMFSAGQNGEFVARYSPEFQRECVREELVPGEVLIQLLNHMHPFGDTPHPSMIRACIVFCHDHDWTTLKGDLEQEFEPPVTPDEYMSQLVFAERFGLENLIRVNVQRAESSCKDLAEKLEHAGVLNKLGEKTREAIIDRMCSGWGLNPQVNRLATRMPTKFTSRAINLHRGKPIVIGDGRAVDTLNSIQSDYVFGEAHELVVMD